MSWTTALDDLRTLLSDGATDKLRYRKRVFGECNGVNTSFKTLEFRRITDFTVAVAPFGIWISGALQLPATVSTDFTQSGDFVLATAPTDGQVVEASYYVQWFTDAEINQFLRLSSNWLSMGDVFANLSEGLRPAALKYAASEAYQKLALRWTESLQETYLLNDSKEQDFSIVDQYRESAKMYREDAEKVRDDFYSKSGQQKQALFGNNLGTVIDVQPKR